MPVNVDANSPRDPAAPAVQLIADLRRQEALLKTGALQNAIFNSANFSSIATDASGVIQIFNVGAAQMLGSRRATCWTRSRRPTSLTRTN